MLILWMASLIDGSSKMHHLTIVSAYRRLTTMFRISGHPCPLVCVANFCRSLTKRPFAAPIKKLLILFDFHLKFLFTIFILFNLRKCKTLFAQRRVYYNHIVTPPFPIFCDFVKPNFYFQISITVLIWILNTSQW